MIKLLLHESKRRVGSPGVFITPGTYFILNVHTFVSSFNDVENEFLNIYVLCGLKRAWINSKIDRGY